MARFPPPPRPPENVALSEWRTPPSPPKPPPCHRRYEGGPPTDWVRVLEVLTVVGVAAFILSIFASVLGTL